MGQGLLNPPTVEGWHEGIEWINSGALVDRVNFVSKSLGDTSNPGVQAMIDHLAAQDGGVLSPEEVVDGCLELLGPIRVPDETRATLVEVASKDGELDLSSRQPGDESEQRVGEILRLAASTRAYQLA